jgi:glucose/arabinose dehydrogenase
MRTAALLIWLVLLTASCGHSDDTRIVPVTPSPLANPTASAVAPPTTPTSARYVSSVLLTAVPSAESLTIYDGQLVIAQVMLGARHPDTRSQLMTVPLSGGVPAVIDGTYRDGGVAVTSLATGPDGVYVTVASNTRPADNEVYRLASGVHTTIAGGPFNAVPLHGPSAVAFGRAGELFISDSSGRVRRVDGRGTITTFAGSGTCVGAFSPPTPAPAIAVAFCGPELLAADGAGNLYLAGKSYEWIDVVDENGMLRVFATDVDVDALHIAPDGELFASESSRGGRLLRYDKAGHATVVATDLGAIADFAFAPDGNIYVLHWPPPMLGGRINRITVLSPR